MTYTTKKEWAEKLAEAGIELPENWGKMSSARAEDWAKAKLNVPGSASDKVARLARSAVSAIGAAAHALDKYEFYPSYPGPDPEPMTRQVRRQNERRASKMPIGARQSAWHALNGFGRIGSGV